MAPSKRGVLGHGRRAVGASLQFSLPGMLCQGCSRQSANDKRLKCAAVVQLLKDRVWNIQTDDRLRNRFPHLQVNVDKPLFYCLQLIQGELWRLTKGLAPLEQRDGCTVPFGYTLNLVGYSSAI